MLERLYHLVQHQQGKHGEAAHEQAPGLSQEKGERSIYPHLNRGDEAHHLLPQQAVVGEALERDEIKLFQLFLGIRLLAFGAQRLLTRL